MDLYIQNKRQSLLLCSLTGTVRYNVVGFFFCHSPNKRHFMIIHIIVPMNLLGLMQGNWSCIIEILAVVSLALPHNVIPLTHWRGRIVGMASATETRSPGCQMSHPPLNPQSPASFNEVTRLPPENTSAPLGHSDAWWSTINVSQVSSIPYLFACKKSERPMSCNMVKSGFTWSRVFRRRHLGRRVTAVTCLRWPTVF